MKLIINWVDDEMCEVSLEGEHLATFGYDWGAGDTIPSALRALERLASAANKQIAEAWDEGEAAGRENEYDREHPPEFQEPWTNPYRYEVSA